MISNSKKTAGFAGVALVASVGISLLSVSAFAQAPAAEATAERVVVTGSFIPTAEEVSASPLDTITTQEINRAGTSDVLTVLQKRNPDFVGAGNLGNTNANISSGSTQGGAVIQIRGLPTLVLFENRRIADSAAISTGGAQFSDVNLFPISLISRIEVLKDGASALYGSDAVGGVVNIFLKKDFTGVEIGGRYGTTVDSAISERKAWVIAGLGNDTTHVTVGVQYYEQDPLFSRQRAYSASVTGGTTNYPGSVQSRRPPPVGGTQRYLLRGVNPSDPFGPIPLNSPFDAGVVPGATPLAAGYGAFPGVYVPASLTQILSYNLANLPTSTLDVSDISSYAAVTHQIFGKQLEFFGDFLYARNHSLNTLNAQPVNTTVGVVIPAGRVGTINDVNNPGYIPGVTNTIYNPFNTQIDQFNSARNQVKNRFQRLGAVLNPRTFTNDTNFYRFLTGLRSEFAKDWTFETAAFYSKYDIDFVNGGLLIANQLNAMIAGTAVDNNGNNIPVLDFFAINPVGTGPGQVSASQLSTAFGTNIRKQSSYQEVFDAHLTGFPFSLPAGPVGIALGAEYRVEGFKVKDSPEIFLFSVPIQEINASRYIYSVYGEVNFPIVSSAMNIPAVYNLSLDLAGRFDHYQSVSEDALVPKISLRYQPIKDLTLRASFSNSFVAPNLYQLFGPNSTGFSTAITFNGVPQSQAMVLTGSNPRLVPSKAQSYGAGLIYSPSFIPGLVITADYFRTLQQQIAGVLGGGLILNSVNNSGPASPYASLVSFGNFPGRIGATPVNAAGQLAGQLDRVFYVDTLQNIGAERVEGFDLSAKYTIDFHSYGQLELGVNAIVFTLTDLKTTQQSRYYNILGLDQTEGVGATPDYKLTFLAEYRWNNFTLSANANYIPELLNAVGATPELDNQSTYPVISDYFAVDSRLSYTFVRTPTEAPAMDYSKDGKSSFDRKAVVAGASVLSPVDKILNGLTLTVGCNNVFDVQPPLVANANSNTDLSIYDPYGQFVYFEVSKKF